MNYMNEMFNSQYVKGENADVTDMLKRHHIVDIGIISSMNKKGFAKVTTFQFMNGYPIVQENVEVLFAGGVTCNPRGQLCLLVTPTSCLVDSKEKRINYDVPPHSNMGMKAIPLTNGMQSGVQAGFDSMGGFSVAGEGVRSSFNPSKTQMAFGSNSVTLDNEGNASFLLSNNCFINYLNDGSSRLVRFDSNENGAIMIEYSTDGTYIIKSGAKEAFADADYDDLSSFNKWTWVRTYKIDGSLSHIMYSSQADDKQLMSLEISPEGNLTFKSNKVSITTTVADEDTEIALDVNGTTVSIDKEGAVTISVAKALSIEGQDAVTIKSAKALTLEGSDGVTITGDLNVNNGNLEVSK